MSGSEETLIDQIYEAAAVPESWPQVLASMCEVSRGAGFALLTRRSDNWTGYLASESFDEALGAYLTSGIAPRSDATRRLLAGEHAGFLSDTDLFSEEQWEKEPLRNDWARAWGLNHAVATAIEVPTGDFIVFHGQRVEGAPAFSASDKAALDRLRPHLARAGLLAARWRLQRLRSATEALSLLGLPAAVLDGSGRVLTANALMEDMSAHVSWLADGKMGLADSMAQARLEDALNALHVPGLDKPSLSFAIRPAQASPAVLHVIPTKGDARDVFGAEVAIVVVTPVAMPNPLSLPLLKALFDLSAGEARVAAQIARGATLHQLASSNGVSKETVRSQLRQVLIKTGAKRQAEVAALLSSVGKYSRE